MTIHSEHPFQPPEGERDPLRRFRGRMVLPVTLWTTGAETPPTRAGWTVASTMVADGPTPVLLGLLDTDSDLADHLGDTGTVAVSLLGWRHRGLADAFAGVAPAPGGPFRLGRWTDTTWGPVLSDASGWLGARLSGEPKRAGWSLLVRADIEHVEAGEAGDALAYWRGRYRAIN